MFSSGMKEGSSQEEIPIVDIDYGVFLALIEFCYTGKIDLDPNAIVELYMAANQYRLGDLKQVSFDIIFH
jgi:hypothetical protein